MLGWLLDALGLSRFARLSRQAASPDTALRAQAAAGLATVLEPRAAVVLLPLLADHEPTVRDAAAGSLAKLGPVAVPALIQALKDHRDAIASRAAELLGGTPSADAVQPLLHALKYAPRPVQLAAHRTLVKLGPLAVPGLEAARSEPQPWVKGKIEEALAAIGAA